MRTLEEDVSDSCPWSFGLNVIDRYGRYSNSNTPGSLTFAKTLI